jgi:2-keto-4-pentenoate hydratase/2-oxohepta-3-ene-1,7-dioic acid hydratase in catechol pathway
MTYRLITFRAPSGPRAGIVLGDAAYDLAELSGKPAYASVRAVLDDWNNVSETLSSLAVKPGKTGASLNTLELLPPVLHPGAIYCAGANYSDHVANMARVQKIEPEPDPHELGLSPWHFIKASWCTVGHQAKVELTSEFLDWEAELAVVIGRKARNIGLGDVFDYVAGYTIANDLSARDHIFRDKVPTTSPFRYDWIGQKSFDGACPLGPWLAPATSVGAPQNLGIRTYVNDSLKQNSNTSKMLFSIAEQISYLSSRITLHPGDVVLTGTPSGVGIETGERLKRGDRVRIEIESLGELITYIV